MNNIIAEDYKPYKLNFNGGIISSKDPAQIPLNNLAWGNNITIADMGMPTQCSGRQLYNSSQIGSNTPISGMYQFLGEDGTYYIIVACNGGLYYSNGNGAFSAIKYLNDNVAITCDTTNNWYNFQVFSKTISGTQKQCVYMFNGIYPCVTNSNGTNAEWCTIARSLRLYISSGVIYATNIFSQTDTPGGTGTAGSDDVMIGTSTTNPFPKGGKYAASLYGRLCVANTNDLPNGYYVSVTNDPENWTDPNIIGLIGGGKYPEPMSGIIAMQNSLLIPSRHSFLRVDATPSSFSNWRETFVPTYLGNVGRQMCLHYDGWVYFISEEGIARTNGQYAERVDLDIEDQIKPLTQLQQNQFDVNLSQAGDWNVGTPSNGDNLLSTAEPLKQLQIIPASTRYQQPTADPNTTAVISSSSNCSVVNLSSMLNDGSPSMQVTVTGNPASAVILVDTGVTDIFCKDLALNWNNVNGNFTALIKTSTDNINWTTWGTISANGLQHVTQTNYTNVRYIQVTFSATSGYAVIFHFTSWDTKIATYLTTIDYGTIPSSFGSIVVNAYTPSGSQIDILGLCQSVDSGWSTTWSDYTELVNVYNALGLNDSSATVSLSANRYLKLLILQSSLGVVEGAQGNSIIINTGYIGGQWLSAIKDLGSTPSGWGTFITSDQINGQSLIYEIRSASTSGGISSATFATITSGSIPTNTLYRYIQFRVSLSTTGSLSLPYVSSITLNYFIGSASKSLPTIWSYKDQLFASFQANGQPNNDLVWCGETKPVQGVAYTPSIITGINYPMWSYRDFMNANVFQTMKGQLISGNSVAGYVDYELTGTTNRGAVINSYIITAGLNVDDVKILLRYFYLHYRANQPITIQWRTRNNLANWSAWSSALTLAAAIGVSRSLKQVPPSPIVQADFIQFIVTSNPSNVDTQFAVQMLMLYMSTYPLGR